MEVGLSTNWPLTLRFGCGYRRCGRRHDFEQKR